jgi:Mg2+ and Co2+ transporter CorA
LTLAQLLHLHPLTLEDILQQETREKLELFPGLGYYFIVFRAIETRKARERVHGLLNPVGEADGAVNLEEGIVGEAMVYLVVFREGVCSVSSAGAHCRAFAYLLVQFHFSDITGTSSTIRSSVRHPHSRM